MEPCEVRPVERDPELRRRLLQETRLRFAGQYSRERVYRIARELLATAGGTLQVEQMRFEKADDLIRLIFLRLHGRDKRAPFELVEPKAWKESYLTIGRFAMHPGELRWKFGQEGLFDE